MKKKLLTLVMLLVFSLEITIYASDVSSLTAEQKEVKEQISDATDKIMEYEDDIAEINDKIDENDAKIKELEENKKTNEQAIKESREELDPTLIMMQKMNNTNMLATYFYDENSLDNNYFLKLENINTMFESVSGDMKVFIEEIESMQKDIDEVNKLKKQNKKELEKLNDKLAKQEELETSLKQELADIEEEIGKVALTSSGSASSSNKDAIMSAAGISSSDYQYVDYIISKESGWNSTAANPMSSAYGLCQSLPGSKMASAGSDWATNPVTQMKWCNSYAVSRYGSWAGAYNFWISNHWW
ncbi:hypothetical protein R2F61_06055 [Mollicutes bacterium LVI A0078]|nr:hypothetical protein RZE84_06060 [Mollicutes bacterium LVI A0075]WOO90294.1 hypothetical protein R2F61_06055 [Mollicutes bacterium LVI A0078]